MARTAAKPRAGGDSFLRAYARTRRFTLGEPRNFTIAPDGSCVLFLRSRSGTDPVTCLWRLDTDSGEERLLVDPAELGDRVEGAEDLPEAERRRRERSRESAEGVTAYATDRNATVACFAVAGRLFTTDVAAGTTRELAVGGPVFDPRPDPGARSVAYVSEGSVRLTGERHADRLLAGEGEVHVAWGVAEFIAAEEMSRSRGYWWSPTGRHLAVCRVDTAAVPTWHIADPAHPDRPASEHRYPTAGSTNAEVRLFVVDLQGKRIEIEWDRDTFPYLTDVVWQPDRPLTLAVQRRDQRVVEVLVADIAAGTTRCVHHGEDPCWVELVPGVPRWVGENLVTASDADGSRRLYVEGTPITPVAVQVRAVIGTVGEDLLVTGAVDPTESHLYRVSVDGFSERLTVGAGVHSATGGGGDVIVVTQRSMDFFGHRVEVRRGNAVAATISSVAERPRIVPRGAFYVVGKRELRTALLLPRRRAATPPFPVLMDPYGGPHAQRVLRSRNELLVSQWFADQGFAVVIVDGRGTPARGSAWEREIWGDLAAPVLDDQVDALQGLADADDRLDVSRVGIRGWSFGGYLAALAVLRRPDIFGAAVAGAPVTDWRLYDTHYTERYLGHPEAHPEHYERTSLIADAARLQRPLMLIHGMSDDNVVVAHTLQLSSALLAAGRPHTVLPLSGVTHMTPQVVVAENLLRLQVEFLQRSLGFSETSAAASP